MLPLAGASEIRHIRFPSPDWPRLDAARPLVLQPMALARDLDERGVATFLAAREVIIKQLAVPHGKLLCLIKDGKLRGV